MQYIWEKPVITFYKERFGKQEKEPFVAVKAQKLVVTREIEVTGYSCHLEDFFPIMGSLDYISSKKGKNDSYVLCWFDDKIDDFTEAFRRLTAVTFQEEINCTTDKKGKETCNAKFEAKHGKLE